jgi:hypothetical protein
VNLNVYARERAAADLVAAIIKDANRLAEMTADYLDQQSAQPGMSQRHTADFLVDLGAILRIESWEKAGIKDLIVPHLPASGALRREKTCSGQSDSASSSPQIAFQVFNGWLSNCALPRLPTLEIDMALPHVEEELLLTHVSQLLWRLRHIACEHRQ